MVRIKNSGCRKCCCNDCGIQPKGDAKLCCYCHCDELCVTVSIVPVGPDPIPCDVDCICQLLPLCECVESRGILSWDADECYFSGAIRCGTSLIDLQVQIKRYSGVCYVCVDSSCLGLSGEEGGNGCFPLAECGEYGDDCEAKETTLLDFTIDISGCGDVDCGDARIVIKCQNVINPQPNPPDTKICKDCDCVCECICITYTEGGCTEAKLACYDDEKHQWVATFDGDCPFALQTITIQLIADSAGCCRWKLTSTRGSVDGFDPPTFCPRPNEIWTLNDIGATVEIACSTCDVCELDAVCCNFDLPETLYARICSDCDVDWCLELTFQGATASSASWKSNDFIFLCKDALDFACKEITMAIEFVCLENGTLWQIVLWCQDVAVQIEEPDILCEPFCASHTHVLLDSQPASCGYKGVECISVYEICISERKC